MPGARCTRSLVCKVLVAHEVVATGPPEHPAFPHAMVLTAYFALSPVIGLGCHRRLRGVSGPLGLTSPFRKLDASVEASGPHDFAVRSRCPRQKHRPRPPHPAPRP
jgi:hypothetical protein